MEFHHLEYFTALGETLNYTQAAEKCHVSRQGLRQAIASLESEYSVKLVVNTHNKLSLTTAGKMLLERSRTLLKDYQNLQADLRSYAFQKRPFRIGISLSLIPYYAPEIIELLNDVPKHFPSMKLQFMTENADLLLDRLDNGGLDAVILVDFGCLTEGYHRTVIRADRFGMALSRNHPLASKPALQLTDFEGQTIGLMSAPERCFLPFMEALIKQGIHADFQIEPDFYESFRKVRNEGILCMDRLEWNVEENSMLDLEVDLPVSDFHASLETVFLLRDPPEKELLTLAEFVADHTNRTSE